MPNCHGILCADQLRKGSRKTLSSIKWANTVSITEGCKKDELASLVAQTSKESACNVGLGRFPWRRVWLPTPVFLPGESHEQKPGRPQAWGCEESDTTEQPSTRRMRFNDVHKIFGPG